MKKSVLLFAGACLLCSSLAHATCTGGTEYMGKVNTTQRLCMSSASSASFMNWWSAFAWCNANGMHLATWMEMCRMKSDESLNCYHRLANAAYPAGLADPVGTTLRAYIEVNGSYTYYKTADRVWTGSKALCAPNSQ